MGEPSPDDSTCFIYKVGESMDVLLVACQYIVEARSCKVFVKALMDNLAPDTTVFLGSVPVSVLRSALPPATGVVIVETDAYKALVSKEKRASCGDTSFLPP